MKDVMSENYTYVSTATMRNAFPVVASAKLAASKRLDEKISQKTRQAGSSEKPVKKQR